MSFGNKLRMLIEENELTQKEFAKQLNIAPSTIGSYVQNKREPDFEILKTIAAYFKVSTDYLLDFDSNQNISNKESELLRVFRSLNDKQQEIFIEQGKVLLKIHDN